MWWVRQWRYMLKVLYASLVKGLANWLAEWIKLARGGTFELILLGWNTEKRKSREKKSACRKPSCKERPFAKAERQWELQVVPYSGAREWAGKWQEMRLERNFLAFSFFVSLHVSWPFPGMFHFLLPYLPNSYTFLEECFNWNYVKLFHISFLTWTYHASPS